VRKSGLFQDLRFAMRQFSKTRGFTAIAVLTLGLGIGANTAIFCVVNGVLLNPLPFRNASRIVAIVVNRSFANTYFASTGMLYGVSTLDGVTFCGVISVVLGVAAFSTFLPTARAARTDPMQVLREG
jgi:ABC-type antimicrobial peptide transport system permease subunit